MDQRRSTVSTSLPRAGGSGRTPATLGWGRERSSRPQPFVDGPPSLVFGCGLPRTGTTTLTRALRQAGFRVMHGPFQLCRPGGRALLSKYQVFADNPIPLLAPRLAREYPEARFIETVRPLESWIASMQWLLAFGTSAFFQARYPEIHAVHRALFGTLHPRREDLVWAYEQHRQRMTDVATHVGDRFISLAIADPSAPAQVQSALNLPFEPDLTPRHQRSDGLRRLRRLERHVYQLCRPLLPTRFRFGLNPPGGLTEDGPLFPDFEPQQG